MKIKRGFIFILTFLIVFLFAINVNAENNSEDNLEEVRANRLKEAEQIIQSINNSTGSSSVDNSNYSSTGRYVFIDLNSSKYHSSGCDYLNGRPYKVGLEWAQNNGYGACEYCNPYSLYSKGYNNWWNNNIFIVFSITIICILFILLFIKNKR